MTATTRVHAALGLVLAVVAGVLLAATAAGCSGQPAATGSSAAAAASPSPGATHVSPVSPRLEGEASQLAKYENSLVGLSLRYDAAAYVLMDDPATLAQNSMTDGCKAAVDILEATNRGAEMWIIVMPTPDEAGRSASSRLDWAYRTARWGDEAGKAGLAKGSTKRLVDRRTIAGLPAYMLERRGVFADGDDYAGAPVRLRSSCVVTRRNTYIFLIMVFPNDFAEGFRGFDKLLKAVKIVEADAA